MLLCKITNAFLCLEQEDFVPVQDMVVLLNSETLQQQCINIGIVNDVILEDTEVFSVSLSSEDSAITLNPDLTSVSITDNDGELYYETPSAHSSHDRSHLQITKDWFKL